ncbi:hypothetical protein ISTM_5 [Insectomime virus]|uniref:Uncharacterized protein n=1 Tax=Tunisvirus fontaine2 TaxID=1421067 RepID=V9SE71_9VIRU|nr:hypothetical protein D1R32_gp323 [Tunisvirus fontaine2]AHA45903.1 hypothetical protein ISTM_5 [Insectomime virus]AHC55040.1 hypothetical protein TNS_ORF322 [Tunisvirus fontaine2]
MELFPSVYIVLSEPSWPGEAKCLFYSRDKEEAESYAENHMEEIRDSIDEEEFRVFLTQKEDVWTLKYQSLGLLWDGPIELHTRVSVQKVETNCDRV